MSLSETWVGLCTPAQIYAVLALLTIVGMAYKQQYGAIIVQAIFAALWTFVLGWICTKGWTWLSWLLILFPVILAVGFVIFIVVMGKNASNVKAIPQKQETVKSEQQKVREYFSENQCAEDEKWDDENDRCVKNNNEYFYNDYDTMEHYRGDSGACSKQYTQNECLKVKNKCIWKGNECKVCSKKGRDGKCIS